MKKLNKELKLLDVYAIATGATLSAGFFLLPGLAAVNAGPALILAYFIAAIPLIPAMFSIVELSTAMPRAGGVYYFLDRSLGPLVGTIGGIGTWLSLILKVTFALIGMGAYLSIFIPGIPIKPVAIGIAVILGVVNFLGTKKSGGIQILLVAGLLILLGAFMLGGISYIEPSHFNGFFDAGASNILSTAGLVYISYVGITKVASMSEEVKDPESNLPKGIFLAFGTAFLVYLIGTIVIVGILPMSELAGVLTPVADAAGTVWGKTGAMILSFAALLAFTSVANAGTMSASRYPLAMSRDHIMPRLFLQVGKRNTPHFSILLTVSIIIIILILLDPMGIAKLASAFQLLIFAMICLAVIVMRESKIDSYDPGYHSPLYPWLQILGIISALVLIVEMGLLSILFSSGLILLGGLWYWYYARKRVIRSGAIYHIFERLGQNRYTKLDSELRGILKEKGLRTDDPFDEIVTQSQVFDLEDPYEFEEVVKLVSEFLETKLPLTSEEITKHILTGTRMGATPVTHGVALPHFRVDGIDYAEMVLVRCKKGVNITVYNPITQEAEEVQKVGAIFFLISPENNPTQHLRILAQIAGRVDEESFEKDWAYAENEQEQKEALLRDERFMSLFVCIGAKTENMINKQLKNIKFPSGCLVAILKRGSDTLVPMGRTMLKEGDRLTIIGDPNGMAELKREYIDEL